MLPKRLTHPLVLAGVMLVAGWVAYANSLAGPFVFDDQVAIVGNPSIRHLATALSPPHGQGFTTAGRPVLNLSFALNFAAGRTAVRGYHLANLAIHLLASLTLWGILRRTLPAGQAASAWWIALLWCVHPLQTEAVTYLVQRAESLMALFYLLTLYCFIRSADPSAGRPRPLWAAFAVGCCFLGMATKEDMVSAPLIVFLYDRAFLSGSFRPAWSARWRFHLAMAASWLPLAALVCSAGGNRGGSVGWGTGVSWTGYWVTQIPALARYLRLAFWPASSLVFDYGPVDVSSAWSLVPEAMLVIGLLAGTVWALRSRPALGLLGAVFFGVLAPTSLLPGPTQMIAEHRMYLPLAAVLAASASLLFWRPMRPPWLASLACAPIAVALIASTRGRNHDYRSELALWADTVAKRPHNAAARNNYGNALKAANELPAALEQYRAALALEPHDAKIHNNLAGALDQMGRVPEAIAEVRAAIQLAPDFTEAHFNLGCELAATARPAEAIAEFQTVLRLRPTHLDAWNDLGNVLDEVGRIPEAVHAYERAAELAPDNAAVRYNLRVEREKAQVARIFLPE